MGSISRSVRLLASLFGIALTATWPSIVHADRWKFAGYGIYMVPSDEDARHFSRPGWGGGAHAEFVPPGASNQLSVNGGFEIVNLLSQGLHTWDPYTLLRVDQDTSQNFFRIYLGTDLGPHGHGFLRPFAGAHVALCMYEIHTDIVVRDDYDPEKEIRQSLTRDGEAAFGYDFTAGVDLNFDHFLVEGGVRFLKSFNVPQQLGHLDAVRIRPSYLQIYLGAGAMRW